MTYRTLNATEAARRFSEILDRVKYQGQRFEVKRGREVMARIVPAGAPRLLKVRDLSALFAELPKLDPKDRKAFARDLRTIRKRVPPPRNSWVRSSTLAS